MSFLFLRFNEITSLVVPWQSSHTVHHLQQKQIMVSSTNELSGAANMMSGGMKKQ
jgi:hypothetical protein